VNFLSNITRPKGDPTIMSTGPSSLGSSDRLSRALGWFSIGLGAVQLLAPHLITRPLGMRGREGLVRAYGAREIGSGVMSLSLEKQAGLWSRVAGDGLDIVTVAGAYRHSNPKRGNIGMALVMLIGVAVLDIVAAQAVTVRHARPRGQPRDYRDRSGFPQGVGKARGAALAKSDRKTPGEKAPEQQAPEQQASGQNASEPAPAWGAGLR